jgi:hypothetical protein
MTVALSRPLGRVPEAVAILEKTADVQCVCVVNCTARASGAMRGMDVFGRFRFE